MVFDKHKGNKPPYLIGLLGIIPLVGAIVGLVLVLYGIFRYKDRKLVIIGSLGIGFTIAVYSALFLFLSSDMSAKGFSEIAQTNLNSLVDNIEYYKMRNGAYPDSLEQLEEGNKMVLITDPMLARKARSRVKVIFIYKKLGEKYTLHSVGKDGIPNTEDDIYPNLSQIDPSKYGLVKEKPVHKP